MEQSRAAKHRLDDGRRLKAIERLDLVSGGTSLALDRLTRMASLMLGTPIALVSIVDDHRQVFKSQFGFPEPRETPLSHSFCQHVVTSGQPLIVEDSHQDDLVKGNLAIRDYNVRAYAGLPMTTSAGEALGSFCVIDTKPRQWTTAELSILEDLREAAMVEIELRELTVRLETERELRQETTSLLVHDFRTPLSTIIAAARTAMDDASCVDEMLSITLAGAERMQSLISELLDVDRLERFELHPDVGSHDLGQLVADTVRGLSPLGNDYKIVFEVEIESDLRPARIDPSLIRRVLENLLSNAIRYADPGTAVRISVSRSGEMVRCSVSNLGQGIPPELQDLVFARYGRVESAKKNSSAPSTGLGLRFCKLSIEAHGGDIGVHSEVGGVTTFWFVVPSG